MVRGLVAVPNDNDDIFASWGRQREEDDIFSYQFSAILATGIRCSNDIGS